LQQLTDIRRKARNLLNHIDRQALLLHVPCHLMNAFFSLHLPDPVHVLASGERAFAAKVRQTPFMMKGVRRGFPAFPRSPVTTREPSSAFP